MGRRFDVDVLGEVVQQDEARLLQLLKALIEAQLLVEESADHFSFRHALTREAIYNALLARARRPLHRAIGEAIERRFAHQADVYAADLAYHFYEGGMWAKALNYARRAGERAQMLFAWRAAVEHFTRAIQAADRLGADAPAGLYLARGQASDLLGDFDNAREDYERAHAIASAVGEARIAWQCLLALGFLWTGHDYTRAEQELQRALDVAQALGDPALLAHSLNRVGNVYANTERQVEAVRMHTEAVALFEHLGDLRGQATSLDLLGSAHSMLGDLPAGAHCYERAIELFRRTDDRPGLVSCLAVYLLRGPNYYARTSVAVAATYAELVRDAQEALRLAQAIDSPPHEATVRVYFAYVLGALGRFAEALEWARRGLAIADEIDNPFWGVLAHQVLGAAYQDLLAYGGCPAASRVGVRDVGINRLVGSVAERCWILRSCRDGCGRDSAGSSPNGRMCATSAHTAALDGAA